MDVNINQLMELTGKSFRTIKKLLTPLNPVREDGKASYWDSKEALKLLYPNHQSELAIENLLLERARRKKVELEVEEISGKSIPIEVVAKEVEREYAIIRTQYRTLATKMAQSLAIVTDPAEVQRRIEEEINFILNELSADAKYRNQQLNAQVSVTPLSVEGEGTEADSETEPS